MPGLEFYPAETELNLSYQTRYPTSPPPEAYARLILDVLRGDQSQFVRSECDAPPPPPAPTLTAPPPAPGDELAAAWAVFTPLLHLLDAGRVQPFVYPLRLARPRAERPPHQALRLRVRGAVRRRVEAHRHRAPGSAEGAMKRRARGVRCAARAAARRCSTPSWARCAEGPHGHALVHPHDPRPSSPAVPRQRDGCAQGRGRGRGTEWRAPPPRCCAAGSVWAIDMGGSNLPRRRGQQLGGGRLELGRQLKRVIRPSSCRQRDAPL